MDPCLQSNSLDYKFPVEIMKIHSYKEVMILFDGVQLQVAVDHQAKPEQSVCALSKHNRMEILVKKHAQL